MYVCMCMHARMHSTAKILKACVSCLVLPSASLPVELSASSSPSSLSPSWSWLRGRRALPWALPVLRRGWNG